MLKDIVIQALKAVQNDCLSLSKQHYPTVHNRGISNNHLTSLVERRLQVIAKQFGTSLTSHSIELDTTDDSENTAYRRITLPYGSVWLFPYSIKTANRVFKGQLSNTLNLWREEYAYAIQPNDCVVLVCDHWLNRINTSQQLLDWWHNQLPDDFAEYAQQGILLAQSSTPKLDDVMQSLNLQPCYKAHAHPLKKEEDGSSVKRYVQLYAIFECK
ncbi:hypothetical protein BCT04_12735 [Vibrio breoganii]|uniref:hypothetical protein n=1 Tax=Vibrio breoganii TaxID=553239 RepID=UPI00080EA082|nr:hypothetical protein [Vibrio breoganii]OCH73409.1 hypothetical protein A6D95_16185 [Vibrio breoganii]PMG03025.1 hypothetical protein BCV00_16735 [Vibrio breoganii]PMG35655.1 hypothetical protein BCU93_17335 [Vibrio breoganii]PMH15216.1 hypothetical protein BCU74_02045 [Vibrio breoganii]PMJ47018.1 hypothetical protein BCU21_08580 [Vibrio breoganii]